MSSSRGRGATNGRTVFSVLAGGTVEPIEGDDAGDLLRRHPELVRYARAAAVCDIPRVAFIWMPTARTPPYRVLIEVTTHASAGPVAILYAEQPPSLPYGLTPREIDVLTLVVAGMGNAEIALRLQASTRTVTTHVDRLLAKLGVHTRTAAATLALEEGLLRLPLPGGDRGFERLGIARIAAESPPAPVAPASRRLRRRPLTLGAVLPLVGHGMDDGREMQRATELAVAEVNARGGVAGRRVELVAVNVDIMSADSIEKSFVELASRDVDAITSGYLSHQHVAHEIAADYRAPYLNAATLEAMVSRVADAPSRYAGVFQVCPSDVHYGPGFVSFLSVLRDSGQWEPSSRRLLVLQNAWETTDLGFASAVEAAERSGWEMAPLVHVGLGDEDWRQAADQVRAVEPAAVLLGHYFVPGTVAFLRSFLDNPPPTLVYSLYAPSIPAFQEQLGRLAEGVLWATVTGTYADDIGSEFARRYHTMHATMPGRSHAGIAYDRANIITAAWSRVSNPRDFRSVAQEIRDTVHRGVNGAYRLSGPGQSALTYPLVTRDPSIAQAHLVHQIQDARHRILSPAPYVAGSFRTPPWCSGRKP